MTYQDALAKQSAAKERRIRFSVRIKPLSINAAFQGRRFNTPAKKQYERALALLLATFREVEGPYYRVRYDFYLKNFAMTDWDNLVKPFQDCLVKSGIISDDRRIIEATVRKFRAEKDSIIAEIEGVEL